MLDLIFHVLELSDGDGVMEIGSCISSGMLLYTETSREYSSYVVISLLLVCTTI